MIQLFSLHRIHPMGVTLILGILLVACGRQSDAADCTGLETGVAFSNLLAKEDLRGAYMMFDERLASRIIFPHFLGIRNDLMQMSGEFLTTRWSKEVEAVSAD